jgi:hypothetical protein
MRISFFISLLFVFSESLHANNNHMIELEEILQSELASTPSHSKKRFAPIVDLEGSTHVSKAISMNEILSSMHECADKEVIKTEKQTAPGLTTIAFACRSSENVITTSEVLIATDGESPKVVSYQKMEFEESNIPPSVMLNIIAKSDVKSITIQDQLSPGIRTLLMLAKVGIPVALSFKTAKILAPDRTDWQKHFIAGAIISGATIITAQGLLRTYARNRGYHWSDTKIDLLSSLAGLITSIVAGAGKEVYDRASGSGTAEFRDVMYTAGGGAMVSFAVVIPLDRIFKPRRRGPRPVLVY